MKHVVIDSSLRLVRLVYSGRLEDAEWVAGLSESMSMPEVGSILIDWSGVDAMLVTSAAVRQAAIRLAIANRHTCGLVAPRDEAFGIARMFESFADSPRVRAFRTFEAAAKWFDENRPARRNHSNARGGDPA
jgi:hypothetical protein